MSSAHQDLIDITEEKLGDLMNPGFVGDFSPEEAELVGAFMEDALSEEEAMEARHG